MTNRDHGMATIEVKIFIASAIPNPGAFAYNWLEGKEGVNVK
jgi:hypothetical protein